MSDKIKKSKVEEIFEENTDAPMGKQIKRIQVDEIVHKSKLLINGSNRIAILGSSGTGKSTLLLQLLPMFTNKTKYLIMCSIKAKDNAYDAIENWCRIEGINYTKVSEEMEAIEEMENLIAIKKDNEHAIIIFDDFSMDCSSSASKVGSANQIMTIASQTFRSLQISLIFVTQCYYNLPPRLRENLSMRIVFALGNKYSVDAFVNDTVGLFYSGNNEQQVRSDIRSIYQQVYNVPHKWILTISTPPQIRFGWNDIVYPEDIKGHIEGGEISLKQKKKLPTQMSDKFTLYKQALELGFPKYAYRNATPEQLREFIDKASAKGEKEIGNTAPELNYIIGKGVEMSPEKFKRQLGYYIKMYRLKKNPKHLNLIKDICDKIIEEEIMTEAELRYLLKRDKMDEYLEM